MASQLCPRDLAPGVGDPVSGIFKVFFIPLAIGLRWVVFVCAAGFTLRDRVRSL